MAEDHELARRIVRVFSCYQNGELPEGIDCWNIGFPCAHSGSCAATVASIRAIITADRLEERRATGEVLVKLTTIIRELKKETT